MRWKTRERLRLNPMSIAEKFVDHGIRSGSGRSERSVAWLDRHGRRLGHFIDGAWRATLAGEYFDTVDPSTGENWHRSRKDQPRTSMPQLRLREPLFRMAISELHTPALAICTPSRA